VIESYTPRMNESIPSAPIAAVQDVTGPRIGAAVIDIIILAILFLVMSMLFGESESGDGGFSANLTGVPFLIYVVLSFLYYFGMEFKTGQTIGKMALKLKVATVDGQPLTPGKVAIRTVLRIVDGLPFLYLVGFIAMVASKQKQRIGDMAAGTTVVRA
jgi:uncharacterized RDD family membrane protein YckC